MIDAIIAADATQAIDGPLEHSSMLGLAFTVFGLAWSGGLLVTPPTAACSRMSAKPLLALDGGRPQELVYEHLEAMAYCSHEEERLLEAADQLARELSSMGLVSAGNGGIAMRQRIQAAKRFDELRSRADEQRKSIEEHLAAIEALKNEFAHHYGLSLIHI